MALFHASNNITEVIPYEICSTIITSTTYSQQDLYNLIRVARVFHDQCKALLYVNVSLKGTNSMKVWSNTIREHPYLSLSTKSVTLHLPRKIIPGARGLNLPFLNARSYVDILENFGRALGICHSLEDLQILQMDPQLQLVDVSNVGRKDLPMQLLTENIELVNGRQFENYGRPNDAHVHQILRKDLPFKLKTFSNDFFLVHTLADFLASQPSLETIKFGRGACVVTSGHKMMVQSLSFENLRILDTTAGVWHKLAHCNLDTIENVRCEMTDYTDFEDLSVYCRISRLNNLKSLWVVRKYYGTSRDTLLFTRWVLSNARKLKYFKISDFTEPPVEYLTQVPVESWRMPDISGLETLIFRTPMQLVDGERAESIYPDLQDKEGRRRISQIFMQDLASLKRFELIGRDESYQVLRTELGFEEFEGLEQDERDWMAKF